VQLQLQYLDFGFTFILQNAEETPQCVVCSNARGGSRG